MPQNSSDILESQFGPTELEILYQIGLARIICTKAVDTGQVLELSRSEFLNPAAPEINETHRAVLNGESMGKAFRQRDIEFRREQKAAYREELPAGFNKFFGQAGKPTVVSVLITVGANRTHYADILEVYSPSVDWPELTGRPSEDDLVLLSKLDDFLNGL